MSAFVRYLLWVATVGASVTLVVVYLWGPGVSGTGLEPPPIVVLDPIMAQEPSVIDIVVERLKLEEGLRLEAYRDSGGVLTIGYGFNLEVPMDAVERGYLDGYDPADGVTQEQAEWLLRHRAERAIDRLPGTVAALRGSAVDGAGGARGYGLRARQHGVGRIPHDAATARAGRLRGRGRRCVTDALGAGGAESSSPSDGPVQVGRSVGSLLRPIDLLAPYLTYPTNPTSSLSRRACPRQRASSVSVTIPVYRYRPQGCHEPTPARTYEQ